METSVQTNLKRKRSSEKHANPLRSSSLVHQPCSFFMPGKRTSQNPTLKDFVKNCDIKKTTRPLAGKENVGQTKSNRQPKHNIQEVREYMYHKDIERRKKGLQMRKEAEREDERYKEYA